MLRVEHIFIYLAVLNLYIIARKVKDTLQRQSFFSLHDQARGRSLGHI
jgi:hypothetical protein